MVMGLYFSYINPKHYKFDLFNDCYIVNDNLRKFFMIDLFFHILAFMFIHYLYSSQDQVIDFRFLLSAVLLSVYYLLINIKKVYEVKPYEVLSIFVIANLLYMILYNP